ncbi:MAG: divalent-cation tolerance protein CutA, partial [Gammaproteobacteria bacterium]|nr:divalent-cation tolerance protein CutA [Gammaproteobacteria bacterium]
KSVILETKMHKPVLSFNFRQHTEVTMEFESNATIVYTPINTLHTAENLAELALSKRYAICVNIIRQAVAMYIWEGEIKKTQECLIIFKTLPSHTASLCELIRLHHPYTVPAILTIPAKANAVFEKHMYKYLVSNPESLEL